MADGGGNAALAQVVIGTASGLTTILVAYIAAASRKAARKFMGEHKFLLTSVEQLLKDEKASNDAVVTIARDIERRQAAADAEHAALRREIRAARKPRRPASEV